MKSNYLTCLASAFALSFVFVSNGIAAPPSATDQSDKVTVDVSKNIVLNARDDDGDDDEDDGVDDRERSRERNGKWCARIWTRCIFTRAFASRVRPDVVGGVVAVG